MDDDTDLGIETCKEDSQTHDYYPKGCDNTYVPDTRHPWIHEDAPCPRQACAHRASEGDKGILAYGIGNIAIRRRVVLLTKTTG